MTIEVNIMAWVILLLAGLSEIGWAVGLKYTEGFTRLWPSAFTLVALLVSVWLLGVSMKTLPLSVAYGIWVGIGTVGTVLVGTMVLGETVSIIKLLSVVLIIGGVIGLKLSA